ncbi:hypothetical protein AcW1_007961 [Taiwanofungus camphoratus]|nr:hypothetical protein AcW1_007961 [Antrodia cinnamomea]
MPNNRCSNCITYNYDCTYLEAAKKRGPPKGYVESLETRLEKMEKLLNELCPDADFSKELGGHFDKSSWLASKHAADKNSKSTYKSQPFAGAPSSSSVAASSCAPPVNPTDPEDLDPSDDEVMVHNTLVQNLERMRLNPSHVRFFGKSSSIMFLQTAMDLKREYSGINYPSSVTDLNSHPDLLHRRPQYWSLHPWLQSEVEEQAPPHQNFPDDDLLSTLVGLYFVNVNHYIPLLHRPTFEDGIKDGLHLRDEGFGSVVLLVCAIGSRFTDDPRVFLKEYSSSSHSSGWQWFKKVQMIRKSPLAPPRLYDLQIYCLTATFLQGTSAPQACWTIIGVGVRLAQDVGAHRRKVYNSPPTVEEELWKRAFWVLVSMDRSISHALGRPCAIQDEDFDLDLPIECDDEYWTHSDPDLAFKQPPGKPSIVTFFNCFLRLNQILAFALRTIYSINKSKALLGFVGQQWEQHIVAELDSALNKWIDSVPDHLRWDPNRENMIFLTQSASLYASYYQLQIAVHRPFIPSPRKPSPLSFPSLAICTNAARSCTHVLDVHFQRTGMPMYQNQMALFTAGIVLLLNIWGGKRSGLTTDPSKEMADVHKCMKMLKALEVKWHTAGRLWDILYELASVGDLPLPQNTPPTHKRERDADSPTSTPSTVSATSAVDKALRSIAGSRRVSRETPGAGPSTLTPRAQSLPLSMPSPDSTMSTSTMVPSSSNSFALPIHSDELGRLPLHPGLNVPNLVGPTMHDPWLSSSALTEAMVSLPSTSQAARPANAALNDTRAMSNSLDVPMGSFLAMHPPGVYDSIFTGMPPSLPAAMSPYQQPDTSGMQSIPNRMETLPPGDASYTDNTLAMWSTAPSGFEWDDWGTYISNVSGMNNSMGSSSRPAGG